MEQLEEDVMGLCDKIMPPHVKGNIRKMIVQPAILYMMERVLMTSSNIHKLVEMTEMKRSVFMGRLPHTEREEREREREREREHVYSTKLNHCTIFTK